MKLKLCGYPGCKALASGYYCEKHKAQSDAKRAEYRRSHAFASATHHSELYRSKEWRMFRRAVLADCPYCVRCGRRDGKLHIHHIKPVRDNMQLFFERSNVVVLCESCHAVETQREIESRRVNR